MAELSRVETIFNEAVEVSAPRERAALLDRACGVNNDLRQKVEALLAAHDAAEDLLQLPYTQRTLEPPVLSECPGTIIGRYKLLEQIGQGGFGVVFMAEQTSPVRRNVALKVIKLGMDTKQVIARFGAEQQALAMMDHPNIAHVFDAGATETGRPYFVMELVRGIPITDYCNQNKLNTKERLELFRTVCAAVQHAHTKGIIHRDIKPTNVLVTLHEGEAVPKVIDFGIAKATGQQLTEKTLFTNFAQMIGTPLYMSPEQAEMTSIDVDTRSDIYSLGVLLYELLTGTTPLDQDRLKQAAFDEIRRLIREEEPQRPSTRLSTMDEKASTISAAQRRSDPKQLGRLVRGELDWIVMKALEKQRSRRYETANGLARDIERYLKDETVEACPPSAAYRFSKFASRNRRALATAATVIAALLIGAILSTVLAIRLKHTADAVRAEQSRTAVALAETRRQKEAAEEATAEAEAVNAFLTDDIIGVASPEVQLGRKLTVEEAVQSAAARVGERFKDQPLIEASVRYALAQTLSALGRFDQAEAHARRALDLRRRLLGDDDPRTLHAITVMGIVRQRQGKLSEAEPLYREALARNRRVLGDNHPDTVGSIINVGGLLQAQGKLSEAEPLYREALERSRGVLGDEHPYKFNLISNMGSLLEAQGKPSEAEPLYREALERSRRVLSDDHPYKLNLISNMGSLLEEQGKLSEAEPLYREALEQRRRVLGNDHPDTINSISRMGLLLHEQGKPSEAEPMYREALERARRVLGDDHRVTLGLMINTGLLLQEQGKLTESEPAYREAWARSRGVLGDDDLYKLNLIGNMGLLLEVQGKLSEAEPLLREALERRRRVQGDDHPDTIKSISRMGLLLHEQGKLSDAEPLLREALERRRRVLSDDHPDTINSINSMGLLFLGQGKLADAEPLLREALERSRRALGDDHFTTLRLIKNLAELLQAQGKGAEAEPLLREAAGPVGNLRALEAGSPENLESAIKQATKLNLEHSSPLDLLTCGEYFLLARDDQKAVETINKAIALGGWQPFYQKSLGWALLRRGEGESAHKALTAAMAGDYSATTRAATTRSVSSQPATRSSDDVDSWTAAYLLGAASQIEYVKRWEADFPSLVWFYIGEKLDISGDRHGALAAYRKSANQSKHHRTTNWSEYRIKQITGGFDHVSTGPTTAFSLPSAATNPAESSLDINARLNLPVATAQQPNPGEVPPVHRVTSVRAATSLPTMRPDGPVIRTSDVPALVAHLGRVVTVEGHVRGVSFTAAHNALNIEFGGPEPRALLVWIPPDAYVKFAKEFGEDPTTLLMDRSIRVSGRLSEYGGRRAGWKDRLQITLDDPSQLSILSSDVSAPTTQK